MMKHTITLTLSIIFIFLGCSTTQQTDDPAYLSAITRQGRLLYAYDQACRIALDTLSKSRLDPSNLGAIVAHLNDTGWSVALGRLTATSDSFILAYEVIWSSTKNLTMVQAYNPVIVDTGYYLRAARAISAVRRDFSTQERRYIYCPLPDTGNRFVVYCVPAVVTPNVYPIGGDAKYVVSNSGSHILSMTQLHNSVIEQSTSPGNIVVVYHTHVLFNVPVETDVFYALRQYPRTRHLIMCRNHTYEIDPENLFSMVRITN